MSRSGRGGRGVSGVRTYMAAAKWPSSPVPVMIAAELLSRSCAVGCLCSISHHTHNKQLAGRCRCGRTRGVLLTCYKVTEEPAGSLFPACYIPVCTYFKIGPLSSENFTPDFPLFQSFVLFVNDGGRKTLCCVGCTRWEGCGDRQRTRIRPR